MSRSEAEQRTCNVHALLTFLKPCTVRRDLQWGRKLHAAAVASGNESDLYVATALMKMYARCGSMTDARWIFDSISKPDVVSWTSLLLGYVENGEGLVTLELFCRMKAAGCSPDSVTYVAALKACTSLALNEDSRKAEALRLGRGIHLEIGNHLNLYVQNTLIDMYANCGSMTEAHKVFDSIQKPDVVSWNALLMGYAENGQGHVSLALFSKMKADGCARNSVTFVAAIKGTKSLALNGNTAHALEAGIAIHLQIGCHLDLRLQNTLVDMYAKCGSMVDARRVFNGIYKPVIVSWNALLLGYAENGEGQTSLDLFFRMKADGCPHNSVTYVAALKACTSLGINGEKVLGLEMGRRIHTQIGDCLNLYVQNTLVDMYGKCGSIHDAHLVFDSIEKPDVVSWTALLSGYAETGEGHIALELFSKMKADGCSPDPVAYVALLKACASLALKGDGSGKAEGLERGREIHMEIGDHSCPHVQSALIDMYAKCGSMLDARHVFDGIWKPDVVSWNTVLLGYAENGAGAVALELFCRMSTDGCRLDSVSYVAALKACTSLALDGERADALEIGRNIHSEIGDPLNLPVQNTLIDLYAKCGSMNEAHQVFDGIQNPQVVSWTVLLLGYADNGEGHISLELFSKMKSDGCEPDSVTYVAVLKACGSIGFLALGRKIHSEISEFTDRVVTSLVDLYTKCGSLVEARAVFNLHSKARATWNAMLAGYSICGDTASVFNLFEAMLDAGIRPDGVTLLCLLLCCSHAGLVRKARECLEAMPVRYGVAPDVFHYSCIVDVLARSNQMMEAVSVLRRMPCTPNAATWTALLSACHKWRNVGLGCIAFHALLEIDREQASPYVLMAHIYGRQGMWEEQARVLQRRIPVKNPNFTAIGSATCLM